MQEIDPGGKRIRHRAQKRSAFEIEIGILTAIQEEQRRCNDGPCLTRVQAKVILSWNILKKYLDRLVQKGLVAENDLRLTEKGTELLQTYRRELRPVLNKYGY